jgi:O-antigen/teichoic acid export membrane protein
MGKTEYAWYTVTNSMVGGMNMLTTLGVAVALFSVGVKHVGDKGPLGRVMATCVRYRKIFAAVFGPLVAGAMAFMLWSNECPPLYIAILVAIVVCYLFVQIHQDLASSLLRLVGRYNYPQVLTAAGGVARLVLLGALALMGAMRVWSAMLVTVLVACWSYFGFLRPKSLEFYHRGEEADSDAGREIRRISYNTFPITLHGFFMPQLSIFLLSVFSTSSSVADLGALGRFALVFAVPGAVINNIFQPWLARSPRSSLFRNYLQVLVFGGGVGLAVVALAFVGAPLFLGLLGPKYQGLHYEFLILVIVTVSQFACNCIGVVLTAKGWVSFLWIQPILSIAATIVGCLMLDLSKLSQVLWLGAFPVPFVIALYVALAIAGFRRTRSEA